MRDIVAGQTVLVTGAGGSIGSELCRQLVNLGPERVILAGHGENSIFDILNELRAGAPDVEFVPVIVDIRDRERLAGVFRRWAPIAVFHAAAHKHVPMMEVNVAEAITNNILGTRNVAEMAAEVAAMYLGRVVERAATEPLYDRPLHPYTQALLMSIPGGRTARKAELHVIAGSVPDSFQRIPGCPFHPRCREAVAGLCDGGDPPQLLQVQPGHEAACFVRHKELTDG